jgi:hypothetical protein
VETIQCDSHQEVNHRKVVELRWGTLNINKRWHLILGGLSIVYENLSNYCDLNGIGVVKDPDNEYKDDNTTSRNLLYPKSEINVSNKHYNMIYILLLILN